MRYFLFIFCIFYLSACSGDRYMNYANYEQVRLGSSVQKLTNRAGEPFSTKIQEDGSINYIYLERIELTPDRINHRTYTINVKDNRILSKSYDDNYEHIKVHLKPSVSSY